ncbi:MAG: Type II secretory pathway, component PulM [Idiomarinaceae bacterium]|nr:Type II secretory pathway, component PulM [Idiomarinaceae bacterium]
MSRLTPLLQKIAQTPVVQSAQQRWAQLAVREQNLVKGLGAVIVVAIIYFAIWQPTYSAQQLAERRLEGQQQQLLWLREQVARYQSLSATQAQSEVSGSLSQRVNEAAASNKIQIARMQPQNNGLIVSVDETSYQQAMSWLYALEQTYQLQVTTLDLARLDEPGKVRVRQVLVTEKS